MFLNGTKHISPWSPSKTRKIKNDFRIPLVKYGDIENCETIGFQNDTKTSGKDPENNKHTIRHDNENDK